MRIYIYISSRKQIYHLNDVWDADEFGLFYKMAPINIIGPGMLPSQKKQKSCVTFLACANASGKEKFPFQVIGQSKKPR